MPSDLQVNLALLASLATLGLGLLLGAIGILSARRVESDKLAWVAGGFIALALQGGWFARQVWLDPVGTTEALTVPILLGALATAILYVAIYRRP